jgi:2-oxoglutarate ferredoxin oxidoreductase subunit alpha
VRKRFTFKIGGPAGFGIMSAGLTFSKVATRSGYEVYDYVEYPSLIRGGHNVMQTTLDEEPVLAPDTGTDFLVALNRETIELHKGELAEGSGILCDSGLDIKDSGLKEGVNIFQMPFMELIKEVGGKDVMRNTVALGATMGLLGGNMKHLKDLIAEGFADKKPVITELNHKVAEAGYDYVRKNYGGKVTEVLKDKGVAQSKMVLTGNEAVAMGAVAAGMKFVVIYPMTPISNILHTLAPLQEKYGFVYKQPEDEISAVNMAIGASFTGARAMTATSGGGFCLMTEGLGLAGLTETPLVMVEGMRGAPATGLPTWTEQGDLRFMLHAHQGEFPRIVLAPGDAQEAFELTMRAFNLADKYQCPVIVMVDKYLCENHQSFAAFKYEKYKVNRGEMIREAEEDYRRYKVVKDGVSPRSIPGVGNFLLANSDEHQEYGYSEEAADNRLEQMNKRMRKLMTCAKEDLVAPKVYGPEEAEVTLVSWGSNKGAILTAMRIMNHETWNIERKEEISNLKVQNSKPQLKPQKLDEKKRRGFGELSDSNTEKQKDYPSVNLLHLNWIWPFPTEAVSKVLGRAKRVIDIEGNYSGQLAGLIREQTGFEIKEQLLKYDGRPIYWEEVVEKIKGTK